MNECLFRAAQVVIGHHQPSKWEKIASGNLTFRVQVARHKGTPPLMTDEERFQMVSACKWVDTVRRPSSSLLLSSLELSDTKVYEP